MNSCRRPRSAGASPANPDRPWKKQKRVRDIEEDLADACEADYYIYRNLRFVLPYRHEFRMTCKLRWRGRRILDVFQAELSKDKEPGYWPGEFVAGRVLLNGAPATQSDTWSHDDLVLHVVHRHESPVLHTADIPVVHEDSSFLVVDKPASMPVHPCGTYRKNSLQYLLAMQGWRDLKLVHRLDKQTSGIVIFAKSRMAAAAFSKEMVARVLRKRYLALVTGRFCEGVTVDCSEALSADKRTMLSFVDEKEGKEAQTFFRSLAFDKARNRSLVLCEPTTGRSHQIRVHLQHVGHPIIDDPLYNSNREAEVSSRIEENLTSANLRLDAAGETIDDKGSVASEGKALDCVTCPIVANSLASESGKELYISLHALAYESDNWHYETALPEWAKTFPGVDFQSRVRDLPWLRDMPATPTAEVFPSMNEQSKAKGCPVRHDEPTPVRNHPKNAKQPPTSLPTASSCVIS